MEVYQGEEEEGRDRERVRGGRLRAPFTLDARAARRRADGQTIRHTLACIRFAFSLMGHTMENGPDANPYHNRT